jgi:6-phosphofructokinase 1
MRRIGILTSGGDAPGMNAAIRAAVRACLARGLEPMGIEHGYAGLLEGRIRPLGSRDVSNIIQQGGTVLGTSRSEEFRTPEGRTRAAGRLDEAGIDGLVVVGGDGSFRGAEALAREHGHKVAGIPGTIDNDIGGTHLTLGFDTAVNTAVDAIDRLRDTAGSHGRGFVVEVMGRDCGALAVGSSIAGGAEDFLVPEEGASTDHLRATVRACAERGKRSLIVVMAEGYPGGSVHDMADLVREELGGPVRVTVLGHIQRGGRPSAFDRILGSRMGVKAVEELADGNSGFLVSFHRGGPVETRPLEESWSRTPELDPELLRLREILSL